MDKSLVEANFYLLGYYLACFRRYDRYREAYKDEKDTLSHVIAMRTNYKKLAEIVLADLDIDVDIDDLVPELGDRNPIKIFIRNLSSEKAYRTFLMGDYIGDEIDLVHEMAKVGIDELFTGVCSKETLIHLFDVPIGQFDGFLKKYKQDIPAELRDSVNKNKLEEAKECIKKTLEKDPPAGLIEAVENFFNIYDLLTQYFLAIRNETREIETEFPLYFLSYARNNRIKANQVELILLRENRRSWRDETDLRAGRPLVSSLFSGIEEAHTFVCLISEDYLNSPFCLTELEQAVHRNVSTGSPRVVALRIDKCDLPSILSSKLWLDASTRDKLALAVKQIIEEE